MAVEPASRLGVNLFEETPPIEWVPGRSPDEAETLIRAVYRQVLGNTYVMESERLAVPESQFKLGVFSVREFVRAVAKSKLYRSRFFDNCYRYRSIELNFRHLLGRAPDSLDEIRDHSAILDQAGFEADIDAYLASDEYQQMFGENIVPYYSGYKTRPGKSLLGFTKIRTRPGRTKRVRDVSEILAEVFKPKAQSATSVSPITALSVSEQDLRRQSQAQKTLIDTLQTQLAELPPIC